MQNEVQKQIYLTDKQAEFFNNPARFKIGLMGRGSGKSFLAGLDMVSFACTHPDVRVTYVATTYTQSNEIMRPELDLMIPKQALRSHSITSPITYEFYNGSTIKLYGANNPETFRGPRCDFAVLDEVGSQNEEVYSEILRPAIGKTGGRMLLLGTTKGIGNWASDLEALWRNDKDGLCYGTRITSYEAGIMDEFELELLRKELDPHVFEQEILAIDSTHTGLVYYQFNDNSLSTQEFDPYEDTIISFDFNVNPMTAVLFQRSKEDVLGYVAVNEFMHANSNTENTALIIKHYLAGSGFKGNLQICGDASAGSRHVSSSYTSWQILDGFFMSYSGFQSRHRRTASITARVNTHNQALKQGKVKFNPKTCPKTVDEHRKMEWKEGGLKLDDKGGKMGHITDAASYMTYNHFPIGETKIYKGRSNG